LGRRFLLTFAFAFSGHAIDFGGHCDVTTFAWRAAMPWREASIIVCAGVFAGGVRSVRFGWFLMIWCVHCHCVSWPSCRRWRSSCCWVPIPYPFVVSTNRPVDLRETYASRPSCNSSCWRWRWSGVRRRRRVRAVRCSRGRPYFFSAPPRFFGLRASEWTKLKSMQLCWTAFAVLRMTRRPLAGVVVASLRAAFSSCQSSRARAV